MWQLLAILTLTAAVANAKAAAKYSYPPQHFSMRGVKDIKVIGVRGSLRMHGRGGKLMSLKVRHTSNRQAADDWNLSLDRRGSTLILEVANVTYGTQWRKHIKEEQWPEFDIDLSGPPRPTIVSWRDGKMDFAGWGADLEVSYLSGEMKVNGGTGTLKVQQGDAGLEVRDWRGAVFAQGESGKAAFTGVTGPVKLNWHKGSVRLERCQGKSEIEGEETDLAVSGGGGELQIELPKGNASVAGFQGVLKANGREANWNLEAAAPSDLNVTTRTGDVRLSWKGGAKVFLTTTDGRIKGPNALAVSVREGRKVAEGTLPGKRSGQVFVRTASGAISLSQ